MKFEPSLQLKTRATPGNPDTCFLRVKHICQHLHQTLGYALRYVPIPPQSKHKLWVLGDASFALTGEKSQQGLIVYHGISSHQRKGGKPVQWQSGRQDLIAKSTCDAELIASSEALQQGKNIAIVVAEVINKRCDIEVSSDNAASLHKIRNGWENTPHRCQSTLVAPDGEKGNQIYVSTHFRDGNRKSNERPGSQ